MEEVILQKKGEKFREEVRFFHWIFNLLFLLLALVFIWAFIQQVIFGIPFGTKPAPNVALFVILLIITSIPLFFGRIVTIVDEKEICVSFGYLGWIKRRIPIVNIKDAEVVTYSPLRQFGGWGIRLGRFRGERVGCYSMKGNKGVLFSLSNNSTVCLVRVKKLIIGTKMPERLHSAIKGVRA